MKKITLLLSLTVLFCGCASYHRLYSGAKLDNKELSILKHEDEGISGVGKFRISIIQIDSQKSTTLSGSFNGTGGSTTIEIIPGVHVIKLSISSSDRYRHISLTLNMKPGFTYTIKRNADEISADKPVVVLEHATAG